MVFTSWDHEVSLLLTSGAEEELHLANRLTAEQFLLIYFL